MILGCTIAKSQWQPKSVTSLSSYFSRMESGWIPPTPRKGFKFIWARGFYSVPSPGWNKDWLWGGGGWRGGIYPACHSVINQLAVHLITVGATWSLNPIKTLKSYIWHMEKVPLLLNVTLVRGGGSPTVKEMTQKHARRSESILWGLVRGELGLFRSLSLSE